MNSVKEASEATIDVQAKIAIPIHYGLYEDTLEDAKELKKRAERKLKGSRFKLFRSGSRKKNVNKEKPKSGEEAVEPTDEQLEKKPNTNLQKDSKKESKIWAQVISKKKPRAKLEQKVAKTVTQMTVKQTTEKSKIKPEVDFEPTPTGFTMDDPGIE